MLLLPFSDQQLVVATTFRVVCVLARETRCLNTGAVYSHLQRERYGVKLVQAATLNVAVGKSELLRAPPMRRLGARLPPRTRRSARAPAPVRGKQRFIRFRITPKDPQRQKSAYNRCWNPLPARAGMANEEEGRAGLCILEVDVHSRGRVRGRGEGVLCIVKDAAGQSCVSACVRELVKNKGWKGGRDDKWGGVWAARREEVSFAEQGGGEGEEERGGMQLEDGEMGRSARGDKREEGGGINMRMVGR